MADGGTAVARRPRRPASPGKYEGRARGSGMKLPALGEHGDELLDASRPCQRLLRVPHPVEIAYRLRLSSVAPELITAVCLQAYRAWT
ncbi:hypothetical protein GCM10010398_63620 [Streptomyces fimbriatus]